MRNYLTVYMAGRSFLIKARQTKKAEHLQILESKPIPIVGVRKVSISLIQGKISLRQSK